jgi:exonuclease SbcC
MPSQSHSSALFSNGVKSYLENVFPEGQINSVDVGGEEYAPIIVLKTGHILAAFAFEHTDTYTAYDVLYSGFKKHFSDQKGEWDSFDISFIHCVEMDSPKLAEFCSKVETDVYFCRKYVIPLDPDEIGGSLSRLSFMPLTALGVGSLRPQSAQTFLQQWGVPAELAKHIVVPGRGEDTIVNDCLVNKFGAPKELTLGAGQKRVELEALSEKVRLSQVTIENFRAYRKTQKFDVGDAVTVLYGPNGFGKTSFFDAIDFAVTGSIGRISPSSFRKVAQHLDSEGEESNVSLSYSDAHGVQQIVRNVSDPNNALLDGFPLDRKAILAQLTGGKGGKADRVEHLVKLFRATHLFSQEQQELAQDFRKDSEISADIVSRMLAFEDYVEAVKKAGKVKDRILVRKGKSHETIGQLSKLIEESKEDFERLNEVTDRSKNIEDLDLEIESIKEEVRQCGIETFTDEADLSTISSWRSGLESRLSASENYRKRLTSLVKEVVSLPSEPFKMEEEKAQLEESLASNKQKKSEATESLRHKEERLRLDLNKMLVCEESEIVYEWLVSAIPLYQKLVGEKISLDSFLDQETKSYSLIEKSLGRIALDLQTAREISSKTIADINSQSTRLKLFEELGRSALVWEVDTSKLHSIEESEKELLSKLADLSKEDRESNTELTFVKKRISEVENIVSSADKEKTDFQNLLSQLSHHVTGKDCPLCGIEHSSMEALVQQINSRTVTDSASSERAELIILEKKLVALEAELLGKSNRIEAADSELKDLGNQKMVIQESINRFLEAAKSHDITFTDAGATPAQQIGIITEEISNEISSLRMKSVIDSQALSAAEEEFAQSSKMASDKKLEVEKIRSDLEVKRGELNELKEDKLLVGYSLDTEMKNLEKLVLENEASISELKLLVSECRENIANKEKDLDSLSRQIDLANERIAVLLSGITDYREKLNQIFGGLTELKLPHEIDHEGLLKVAENVTQTYEKLLTLRDKVAGLELAKDTVTTAAVLLSLQQGIKEKEQLIAQEEIKLNAIEPWAVYFSKVSQLLSRQQRDATAQFTKNYGPRTSVIQRRLRSVYGFDDIEIIARDKSIEVRVSRNGETLRPIDYFSQSQQQTLLLGLFLSACSSQTWSSFSPIFLDDPVTHFDDLNTYALLDLIVGLLSTQEGAPQFIISTCDERLFQLARQKFGHLGSSAKFYRFSAIGANGPVIEDFS